MKILRACVFLSILSPVSGFSSVLSGNFGSEFDVVFSNFTLAGQSGVTIQSYQFGGLAGFVAAGGIDSVLSLFRGTGPNATLVNFNDDGDCPPATPNPYCGDSTLHFTQLDPGNYTLAITANSATPIGPTLGAGFDSPTGPLSGTSYYVQLDITAGVPEPTGFLLAGAGLAALIALRIARLSPVSLGIAAAALLASGTAAMAADIVVPNGGDLQAAINAAQPGDTITLPAGSVFTGAFTLPPKSGTGVVTIRTSSTVLRNRAGIRVGPADASLMPALVSPLGAPVFDFASGSHNYLLLGLEIRPAPLLYALDLIRVGLFETSLSQVPRDIEIDRCYIHGDAAVGSKRGITLSGAEVTIRNSYFSDIKDTFQETQAIAGWNGPGPFHIINNHLEAAGIGVLFGGAVPSITGVLPSDIEVRNNHFFKPLSWNPADPSYAGVPWLVKFHYEMKFGQRAIVDGNVFENSWYPPLAGRAIGLGVRLEGGAVPWAVIQDVTITHNIFRHLGAGLLIFAQDEFSNYAGVLKRVTVRDNLFMDISESYSLPGFSTAGVLATVHSGAEDVKIQHNTYAPGDGVNILLHANTLGAGYTVENNLLQHNRQGISWNETFFDIDALNAAAPLGYTFRGNAIQGGSPARFPSGNYFPATNDLIGYANLPLRDLRLLPSSPFYRAGTDGLDIGADVAAVYTATQGVVPGGSGLPVSGGRCVTSLTPASPVFDRTGGTGAINVSAPASCTWLTAITPVWPTVTGGFSNTGPGQVTYAVPANPGTTARSVTLTIGGLKAVIRQNP